MAHFQGIVNGTRGEASRLGHKNSGLRVSANGWNIGCVVILEHVNGKDQVTVYKTGGSNGRREVDPILTYKE